MHGIAGATDFAIAEPGRNIYKNQYIYLGWDIYILHQVNILS